jgi:hypothetical protein
MDTKPLLNRNYHQLYTQIKQYKAKLVKSPPSLFNFPHLEHYIALFGQSCPEGAKPPYRASEILDNLQPAEGLDVGTIKGAIMFIYEAPRSMLQPKMTQNARWGTLTPIFLLAAKEHCGYAYDDWDKSDPKLKYLLGYGLEGVLDFPDPPLSRDNPEMLVNPCCQFDAGGVREARINALSYKSGAKAGQMEKLTSHKMNFWGYDGPKCVQYMFLQTWLAHYSIRTDDMILDPYNWDNKPDSYDLTPEDEPKTTSWLPF